MATITETLYATKGKDTIKIEILDDGRLKITTDKVSAANHTDAEHLLDHIQKACGGPVTVTQNRGGHEHPHEHQHHHQH
jgi:hypothetical protein